MYLLPNIPVDRLVSMTKMQLYTTEVDSGRDDIIFRTINKRIQYVLFNGDDEHWFTLCLLQWEIPTTYSDGTPVITGFTNAVEVTEVCATSCKVLIPELVSSMYLHDKDHQLTYLPSAEEVLQAATGVNSEEGGQVFKWVCDRMRLLGCANIPTYDSNSIQPMFTSSVYRLAVRYHKQCIEYQQEKLQVSKTKAIAVPKKVEQQSAEDIQAEKERAAEQARIAKELGQTPAGRVLWERMKPRSRYDWACQLVDNALSSQREKSARRILTALDEESLQTEHSKQLKMLREQEFKAGNAVQAMTLEKSRRVGLKNVKMSQLPGVEGWIDYVVTGELRKEAQHITCTRDVVAKILAFDRILKLCWKQTAQMISSCPHDPWVLFENPPQHGYLSCSFQLDANCSCIEMAATSEGTHVLVEFLTALATHVGFFKCGLGDFFANECTYRLKPKVLAYLGVACVVDGRDLFIPKLVYKGSLSVGASFLQKIELKNRVYKIILALREPFDYDENLSFLDCWCGAMAGMFNGEQVLDITNAEGITKTLHQALIHMRAYPWLWDTTQFWREYLELLHTFIAYFLLVIYSAQGILSGNGRAVIHAVDSVAQLWLMTLGRTVDEKVTCYSAYEAKGFFKDLYPITVEWAVANVRYTTVWDSMIFGSIENRIYEIGDALNDAWRTCNLAPYNFELSTANVDQAFRSYGMQAGVSGSVHCSMYFNRFSDEVLNDLPDDVKKPE